MAICCGGSGTAHAQKWVNPHFEAHRLDYRDLGYPPAYEIAADNRRITALLAVPRGRVYGATSGKQACLFVYEPAINKVRPLGRIADAQGVYHALVRGRDGKLYLGTGLNLLADVPLTRDFPGGPRAIEEQLWKDITALYRGYAGGHLLRYDPENDQQVRLPEDPCPLEDLGIPAPGNSIYALATDAAAGAVYGISYPDALLFVHDPESGKSQNLGPLLTRRVFSGPERTWRSVPRGLHVAADGRVYTSGDDGVIVYYDPKRRAIARTEMRIPGEYWEVWNYHGYPVVEQFVADGPQWIFGATSDGFLFRMEPSAERLDNLGKPRVSRRVRGMAVGPDRKLYLICGEFEEPCKLYSFDLAGERGFQDLGVLAVDRSPYYAKRAYQFDAIACATDGTLFLGESDRRGSLFLYFPGTRGFPGTLNPSNPR